MAPSTHHTTPGLYLLAWGLVVTIVSWGLITNFRGFADKFTSGSYAETGRSWYPLSWRSSPRRLLGQEELVSRTNRARLIAIPFAIVGPIVMIVGVVQTAMGHLG